MFPRKNLRLLRESVHLGFPCVPAFQFPAHPISFSPLPSLLLPCFFTTIEYDYCCFDFSCILSDYRVLDLLTPLGGSHKLVCNGGPVCAE